jgi:hypothetical protein
LSSCDIECGNDRFVAENEFWLTFWISNWSTILRNHSISQFRVLLKVLDHPVFASANHFYQFHSNHRHT